MKLSEASTMAQRLTRLLYSTKNPKRSMKRKLKTYYSLTQALLQRNHPCHYCALSLVLEWS